jgi:hypothetical protein
LGRWNYCGNVKVVDSVQIDGKGKKELVVFRDGAYIISEHGGTFDLDESKSVAKFEIWNLDTKTVLFEAVSMLKHHKNWFDARIQPSRDKIDEQYKYDFIVNASGNIIIDNFCGSKDAKPDQTVGRYQFINGKYTKT